MSREGVLLLGGSALADRLEREKIAAHILGHHNVGRLEDVLPQCDTVIHLASATTPGSSASHPNLELDNLALTLRLLDLMQNQPRRRGVPHSGVAERNMIVQHALIETSDISSDISR